MTEFEIVQQPKSFQDSRPSDRFELRIKNDGWWKARGILYGDWVAERLATELGIKVEYIKNHEVYNS
jgi:hypothetical protein